MTIALNDTIRNAQLQIISDAIDAGSSNGILRIYSGTQPAKNGAETTILVEIPFADPCALSIANGILTFNVSGMVDGSADNNGTATWARAYDSDLTFVMDMTVSNPGGGGDVQINNINISQNTIVTVVAASIQAGNN